MGPNGPSGHIFRWRRNSPNCIVYPPNPRAVIPWDPASFIRITHNLTPNSQPEDPLHIGRPLLSLSCTPDGVTYHYLNTWEGCKRQHPFLLIPPYPCNDDQRDAFVLLLEGTEEHLCLTWKSYSVCLCIDFTLIFFKVS